VTDPVIDQRNAPCSSADAGATRERRLMTPLQAEMLEDGVVPDQDALGSSMARHDVAVGAGYGDLGPSRLPGPDQTPAPDADETFVRVPKVIER